MKMANQVDMTPKDLVTEMRGANPEAIKTGDRSRFNKMQKKSRLNECTLFTQGKIPVP